MAHMWFCSLSPEGRRSKVAHAIKDGKALCRTNVKDGTRSYKDPHDAGAQACKRCLKAIVTLKASMEPGQPVLKRMTRQGDSFHVVDIDGRLYHFDYKGWAAKLAIEPDDLYIGELVGSYHIAAYDVRPIKDAPTLHLSAGWTAPC